MSESIMTIAAGVTIGLFIFCGIVLVGMFLFEFDRQMRQ
jgi:hypothetical protein